MKSMGFFYSFFKAFTENFIKNILQEMKNGLSLRQQQLQVIMLYIITWAFHKFSCRQNEWYFYFVLTLKDTGIFPKLLFLSDSWVTAPFFHNRFLVINLYLMTVVIHTKQRMWENREREKLLYYNENYQEHNFILYAECHKLHFWDVDVANYLVSLPPPQTPRLKGNLRTQPPPHTHTHTHTHAHTHTHTHFTTS